MNYTEALEYIHSVNWTFCKPGLERIGELCCKLGSPERSLRFVHVAGTNGKGSFSSMLSSILIKAGYRVGLYTSPYILTFNERMRVNGEPIADEELAELTEYVKPIADEMTDKPTEFELITAIAFEYFKRQKCDVVVLEAGMGGRLDSTNIIREPLLSVITGIALDHTAFLGDTVEKIALEKAGIIKDKAPVLYGGTDESAREIIRTRAENSGSSFYFTEHEKIKIEHFELDGTVFSYKSYGSIEISLLGYYQPRNASLVLDAVEILKGRGLNIPESAVRDGLREAKWAARFEVIMHSPLVIFDGAHNPEGIENATRSIELYFGDRKVYVLSGVLKDKDYHIIAKTLSRVAEKAFTLTPENPRALTAEEYAGVLSEYGVTATPSGSIEEAFSRAIAEAERDSVPLVILGSLYTYCNIIDCINTLRKD